MKGTNVCNIIFSCTDKKRYTNELLSQICVCKFAVCAEGLLLKKFTPIVGFIRHARSLIYVDVVWYGTVIKG